MTYALLFDIVNASVLPAWALLILAPNWRWTQKLVHSMLWPLILGGLYFGLMIAAMAFGAGASPDDPSVSFTTIEGVRAIFATDIGVIVGWTHFLVFDLFVGAWEARDGRRRGFSHWLLIPCLFFTFMAGPLGLLLYLILRKAAGKGGWSLVES